MPTTYLIDAGPLGLLAHDRPALRIPIQSWLMNEVSAGATVYLSEVADFEVRRELLRLIKAGKLPASRLDRLDFLQTMFTYLPASTAAWRKAAEFWADARSKGLPTASPDALDADAIVAGQAAEMQATVVTGNAAHIGRWVPVKIWP